MKKETVADRILEELTKATRWMAVSDLQSLIKCSTSAIRRNLRKNEDVTGSINGIITGLLKSQKIQGDQHGRNQWALESADTTGWDNAAPIRALPKPKKSRKSNKSSMTPPGSPVRVSQQATYGGLILMCAPSNKPSLIKAVGDLLVNEFITSGKKFSAFEVTKRLREVELTRAKNETRNMALPLVNSYPVDKAETGEVTVAGYKVPRIEHEDVRAIVHDIFSAGGMPGLDRMMVNGHLEYDIKASVVAKLISATLTTVVIGASTDPDPTSDGTTSSTYDGSSTI